MKTASTSIDWRLLSLRLLAVAILLGLWQAVLAMGVLPDITPNVAEIFSAIGVSLTSGIFWSSLGQTVFAALMGWAWAAVLGILLGLIIGSIPALDRWTSVLIDFGRAFPVIALMPIVIMLLGSNAQMEIVVVGLSCLWPVLVQTIYGSRRQDPSVVDTVRIFRIPALLRFRRVLLPGAMPFIATGLRIAASISILVAVGVEVLSQAPGLGRQITLAQENQRWDLAFAYLFFAGLFGWGVAAGLQVLERRLLKWNRQLDD